jgi:hypothetical protein
MLSGTVMLAAAGNEPNLGGLLVMQTGFARGRAVVVVTARTALTGIICLARFGGSVPRREA